MALPNQSETILDDAARRLTIIVEVDRLTELPAEARTHEAVALLEKRFGVPKRGRKRRDALDSLIRTILSQNTSDANSDRAFDSLKERFPTWEEVLSATPRQIASAIRSGGLAKQKSVRIRNILKWLKDNHGELSLDFVKDLDTQEAVRALTALKGVGIKTVSVTLLFACGRDVFPLDTHCLRICKRLELIPQNCTAEKAHELMAPLVPRGKALSFHVNLLRLGRRICRPKKPKCDECPLKEICAYGTAST